DETRADRAGGRRPGRGGSACRLRALQEARGPGRSRFVVGRVRYDPGETAAEAADERLLADLPLRRRAQRRAPRDSGFDSSAIQGALVLPRPCARGVPADDRLCATLLRE